MRTSGERRVQRVPGVRHPLTFSVPEDSAWRETLCICIFSYRIGIIRHTKYTHSVMTRIISVVW